MQWLILPASFLLISACMNQEQEIDTRVYREKDDSTGIRVTEGTSPVVGEYVESDYEGSRCDDLDDDINEREKIKCEDMCEDIYGRAADECESLPVSLIGKLHQLFETMKNFREQEDLRRNVSEFDFGVMIDVDVRSVLELIGDWSVTEIKRFLIWVAERRSVSLAISTHDEDSEILKEAFSKIGRNVKVGIGTDLSGYAITFWRIAVDGNPNEPTRIQRERARIRNKEAFFAMNELVNDICSTSINCRLKLYCIREEFERASSIRTRRCYYSNRYSRPRHCYIQGPNVWSYWNTLNKDGDLDFPTGVFDRNYRITEDICDNFCERSGEDCKKEF